MIDAAHSSAYSLMLPDSILDVFSKTSALQCIPRGPIICQSIFLMCASLKESSANAKPTKTLDGKATASLRTFRPKESTAFC